MNAVWEYLLARLEFDEKDDSNFLSMQYHREILHGYRSGRVCAFNAL